MNGLLNLISLRAMAGCFALLAVVGALVPSTCATAQTPQIVYDTLIDVEMSGSGVGDFELGQVVTLGGTARQIEEFRIRLGSNENTQFRLKFYNVNSTGFMLDEVFWESDVFTYPWVPPMFNRKIITLDIPSVVVPDTFGWMVAPIEIPSAMLMYNGLSPSVGVTGRAYTRDRATSQIVQDDVPWVWNIQISAVNAPVPEPSTVAMSVIAVGALVVIVRRRRG